MRRRSGRRRSCGGRLDFALGFGQAELAGDQAGEEGVANFSELVSLLSRCNAAIQQGIQDRAHRIDEIGVGNDYRKFRQLLFAEAFKYRTFTSRILNASHRCFQELLGESC